MPEGTGIGVYPFGEVGYARENDEVSSTYLGRHLTFTEAQITGHEHDYPTKGHPVVVGENIVGVAFTTATAVGDQVTIDTEGIWLLSVVALNPASVAVVAGDELFINKSTGIISNDDNKNINAHFGYALGGVNAGQTAIISVKVHWDPDDALESVGVSGTPEVSTLASPRFREYHYEAQNGGYPHGDHLELTITTKACVSAQALVRKLKWTADDNWITGYGTAGEFEIEVGAGDASIDNIYVIHLASHVGPLSGTTLQNVKAAWITLDEYAEEDGSQIHSLLYLVNTDYPYAADTGPLFITAAGGAMAPTHLMKFYVNNVPYWFHASNAIT